ncbi:hypothetical protein ACFQ0B_27980 [Nonomuraea thailandensis]
MHVPADALAPGAALGDARPRPQSAQVRVEPLGEPGLLAGIQAGEHGVGRRHGRGLLVAARGRAPGSRSACVLARWSPRAVAMPLTASYMPALSIAYVLAASASEARSARTTWRACSFHARTGSTSGGPPAGGVSGARSSSAMSRFM